MMESNKQFQPEHLSIHLERIHTHQLRIIQAYPSNSLSLSVSNSLEAVSSENLNNAYDTLCQFLQNSHSPSTLLLLGDAGSGKTTLFQQLAQHCWQSLPFPKDVSAKPALPLFLSLAQWKSSLSQLITDYLVNEAGLTAEAIVSLQQNYTCLLLLDGYDLSQRYEALWPTSVTNTEVSDGWQIDKILVNSRAECFLQQEDYLAYFLPDKTSDAIKQVTELYLRPLEEEQITAYLQADKHYQASWAEFLEENPGLSSLAHNPLLLTFICDYFAQQSSQPINPVETYHAIFQRWFMHHSHRLVAAGLIKESVEQLIEQQWVYTRAVALTLNESGTKSIDLVEDPFAETSELSQWERFLRNDPETYLARQGCPWWLSEKDTLSFHHRDIIKYFAELTSYDLQAYLHLPFIDGEEGIEQLGQLLDREVLTTNGNQLQHLVADILVGDISTEAYFRLVYLSRVSEAYARKAANAITILNQAKVTFSGLDLSNINISGADLSAAILHRTNLQNTNLSGVSLVNAYLVKAKLNRSQMGSIQFGEWPFFVYNNIQVICCAFDPNHCWLAIGGDLDGKIFIVNLQSGECIRALEGHKLKVSCLSFSDDGRLLASGSEDTTIRLWEVESGKNLKVIPGLGIKVSSVSLGKNNGILAACSCLSNSIGLWDVKSGIPIQILDGHEGGVNTVSFSLSGKFLVSGSNDLSVKVWESSITQSSCKLESSYKLKWNLLGHLAKINSVSFSENSKFLASGSDDHTVRLWEIQSGKMIYMFQGHTHEVNSVVFNNSSKVLASGSSDKMIRLWDVDNGKEIGVLQGHMEKVNNVIFCDVKSENLLVSGSNDRKIRLWQVDNFKLKSENAHHIGVINSIAFSPDGKTLVSGDDDKTIRLWDVKSGIFIRTLVGHAAKINTVTFSPDGMLLASGSDDKTIHLWDVKSGESRTLAGHSAKINSVTFSPDGMLLASGSDDKTIQLWDIKSGQSRTLAGHTARINSVTFSPDGKWLASGSDDKTIQLWDIKSGQSWQTLEGHCGAVNTVNFNKDGRLIASGGNDLTIRLWSLNKGQFTFYKHFIGHTEPVTNVCFSWDKKYLVSSSGANYSFGTFDKIIRIWDIQTALYFQRLQLENSPSSLACHTMGYLATSQGNTIKLWRTNTPQETQLYLLRSLPSQQELIANDCQIDKVIGLSPINNQLLQQRGAVGQPVLNLNTSEKLLKAIRQNSVDEARELLMQDSTLLIEPIEKENKIYQLASKEGSEAFICMLIDVINFYLKKFFTSSPNNNNPKFDDLKQWLTGLNILGQSKLNNLSVQNVYQNCIQFLQEMDNGSTALHEVLGSGVCSVDIIKLLLKFPIDINKEDKKYKQLPLLMVIISAEFDIIELLLKHGADVNKQNRNGWNALCLSAAQGLPLRGIKILIDNNADINKPDKEGNTPLHWAIIKNHVDIVKELVKRGANINQPNLQGHTAINIVLQLLLKQDKNFRDQSDKSSNFDNRFEVESKSHTQTSSASTISASQVTSMQGYNKSDSRFFSSASKLSSNLPEENKATNSTNAGQAESDKNQLATSSMSMQKPNNNS